MIEKNQRRQYLSVSMSLLILLTMQCIYSVLRAYLGSKTDKYKLIYTFLLLCRDLRVEVLQIMYVGQATK